MLFAAGEHEVLQCNRCGQVFISGIDLNVVLAEYDESHYFLELNSYVERWEELSGHFQKIVNKIRRYKAGGDFLDVGCSVGVFLDVAKKNGFNVKGVEVSGWASKFAREKGFDVVTGGLSDAGYPSQSFDVVIFNHVLEHIPDPMTILKEARRILRDDGLLAIGVPNFGCFLAQRQKAKWISLMPDQHIWQFTRETLIHLIEGCGFEEVYFESRDNHKLKLSPFNVWNRVINLFGVINNNSEAMLVFANKGKPGEKQQ